MRRLVRRSQQAIGQPQLRNARGFSLIELLIVVAIILIIAAISIPNMLRARISANEAAAVHENRAVNTGEVTYATTFGVGYSPSLAALGPPPGGGMGNINNADLIDAVLATGRKQGYIYTYNPGPPVAGIITTYGMNIDPSDPGSTGNRYFYTDPSGLTRQNFGGQAGPTDPPVN